jgi:hypothetical protein
MKYPKVLYTWITTVQQGRRQYKALYLDVPPCMYLLMVEGMGGEMKLEGG